MTEEKSIIIEFFGLPGVGKTTISQRVADDLQSAGYRCTEPRRQISQRSAVPRILHKSAYVVAGSGRYPSTTVKNTLDILQTEQDSLKSALKIIFNWHYCRGIAACSSSDIRIFDEGIYQALWSVGLSSRLNWETVLDHVVPPSNSRPSVVIIVDAREGVIANRLANRKDGDTRFNNTSKSHFRRGREGFYQIRQIICSFYESNANRKLITVENGQEASLADITDEIVEQIIPHI